jgi:hypothetical protein
LMTRNNESWGLISSFLKCVVDSRLQRYLMSCARIFVCISHAYQFAKHKVAFHERFATVDLQTNKLQAKR